ncbi:MAG: phosphatase PAP2 family protein [Bacteroidaceae bacterium]|nr:phosphatase PAP2 family protein [Bacteroidaceae bacterium]
MKRELLYLIFLAACISANAEDVDSLCSEAVAPEQVDSVVSVVSQDEAAIGETESATEAVTTTETPPELTLEPRLLNLNQPLTLAAENVVSKERTPLTECYYNFGRDFSWMPVPVILAGYIAKSQKKNFRDARQKFEPNFENHLDDWLQHGPLALTFGLKFAGVEGRSDWKRYLVSGVLSYATMGAIVNGIKYSAKEMRPDGSTANSFPSGHTATAFVAATILHKEYGLTRSPWYSVGGYAAATTTGVMRSLNNRHWISDILVGAGIGILATDLGYFFGDMIFRDKHIVRKELENLNDFYDTPSFFTISMGATFMPNVELPTLSNWNIILDQGASIDKATHDKLMTETPTDDGKLRIGTATSVSAEGAYFINPYIGFGGRFGVMTAPIRANGMHSYGYDEEYNVKRISNNNDITDQMSMFTVDGGVYLQFPFSQRFAVGTKALFGGLFTSGVNLEATSQQVEDYDGYGDYINVESIRTPKFGTGVSLTYATKNNIAWKVYADYDYAYAPFNMEYIPDYKKDSNLDARVFQTQLRQDMHLLTVGASMAIRF